MPLLTPLIIFSQQKTVEVARASLAITFAMKQTKHVEERIK